VRIFTLGALLTHGQLYGIGSAVRQGNIHSL
jgi:hypothetical protein